MGIEAELDRVGIDAYLASYRTKDLLRLLTCGSVDDGKSTLIGRLLYDAAMVHEDQLRTAKQDSIRHGTTGSELDFALLVGRLEAEREQGITIDVAYRYFTTEKRKFIIADTPGHEQYTRNMVTGASVCQLAVILIDARKGVLDQTRRHSFLCALLGIRHLVVAINKMDLVGYDEQVYQRIRTDYEEFAARLQVPDIHFVPISALLGENVVHRATTMPWYSGAPLLDYLETVHIGSDRNLLDFRFPVQLVLRPHQGFRGYAGTLASGLIRVGDPIVVLPSGRQSRIESIGTPAGPVEEACAAMAVVLTLTDPVDVSRGDVLATVQNTPRLDTSFEAMLVWMADQRLEPGRPYLLKLATTLTSVKVQDVRYRTNVHSLRREEVRTLSLNEIGRVEIETSKPLCFDPYVRNRQMGSFILIDRLRHTTVAAGMVIDRAPAEVTLARRRSAADAGRNIRPQRSLVTLDQRSQRLAQTPFTLWLTGLPRSGKSSLAFALELELFRRGKSVHVLDGESLRAGLSSDLGFAPSDRFEHQRRAAELAKLSNDTGQITIVALVSPMAADREQARRIVTEARFFEIHCDAPLALCEQRDTDDLYGRARRGEILDLTGIDAPYEAPKDPLLRLDTAQKTVSENVALVLSTLEQRGLL